jgi:Zn-finger protein
MDCIKKKVREEIERGWIGSNLECEYHPCHYPGQDCTFCYCPFYPCKDERYGFDLYRPKRNDYVWDCKDCLMIHDTDVCKHVMARIKEQGITDPADPRIQDLFPEASEIYEKKRSSA